jgi:AcrR family transcriptional regulator
VNKQLIFYYFQSKEGLGRAVIEWAAGAFADLVHALRIDQTAPRARLAQLVAAQFDLLAARPDLVALLSREAAARGDRSTLTPAINRLVAVIAEGQGRGVFRDDIDPHLLASQTLVLMMGYLQFEAVLAASAPPLGMGERRLEERWRDELVKLVLRGALTGPP